MLHRIREKYPDKIPLVPKIPKEEVMVFENVQKIKINEFLIR